VTKIVFAILRSIHTYTNILNRNPVESVLISSRRLYQCRLFIYTFIAERKLHAYILLCIFCEGIFLATDTNLFTVKINKTFQFCVFKYEIDSVYRIKFRVLQLDKKIGILRFENCTFKYTCLDCSGGEI